MEVTVMFSRVTLSLKYSTIMLLSKDITEREAGEENSVFYQQKLDGAQLQRVLTKNRLQCAPIDDDSQPQPPRYLPGGTFGSRFSTNLALRAEAQGVLNSYQITWRYPKHFKYSRYVQTIE